VRRGEEDTTSVVGALALGFAQGLAVLPGLSRSGSTVTVALWLGIKPERAFELSMLMSLPAVLGAVLLELPRALRAPEGIGFAALGALVAFGVGIVALHLLRRVMMKGKFALFALWVLPLGVATLALARAWPG
jgi:undecaprenyl-diphosphatase